MRWLPDARLWPLLLGAALYDLSPVDALPDALPVLGWVDDLGVTGLVLLVWATWRRRPTNAPQDLALDTA